MLHFDKLVKLKPHLNYLQNKLKKSEIFLVWWCVRDLLFGINFEPKDIDATLPGQPKEIYNNIDKTDISHFITEKYGTITLIPKDKKNKTEKLNETSKDWISTEILQYELTPFREEASYTDNRHPDEIKWTSSLVRDALRREFTISCLYYFNTETWKGKSKFDSKEKDIDYDKLFKKLKETWYEYLAEHNLRILQNHDIISEIFENGKLNKTILKKHEDKWLKSQNWDCKIEKFPKTQQFLIDPYLGIQDMVRGILRCVGYADKRFNEDALRIIRALRMVNVINTKLLHIYPNNSDKYLNFDNDTRHSIKKNFFLVWNVAKERIKTELDKVFIKGDPFAFVALMDEVNILRLLFPAVARTKHVDQPVRYHPFDVYHHTLMTLYHAQRITPNRLVRYAALYHDVGKVDQYYLYRLNLSKEEKHKIADLNHRNTSGKIMAEDFRKLWFSNKDIEEIKRYIDRHHKPEEVLNAKPENREKKMRKMLSEGGMERLDNLFDLVLGDRRWHYNPIQAPEIQPVEDLRTMAHRLDKKEGQFTIKKLAINGDDLMKKFKLKPWKHIWEYLQKAFDWTINDIKNRNKKVKIFNFLKEYIKD